MGHDGQDFRYIKYNWGDVYIIIRPSVTSDTWKAIAEFGSNDELIADDGFELLNLIRRHYPGLVHKLGRKYS